MVSVLATTSQGFGYGNVGYCVSNTTSDYFLLRSPLALKLDLLVFKLSAPSIDDPFSL